MPRRASPPLLGSSWKASVKCLCLEVAQPPCTFFGQRADGGVAQLSSPLMRINRILAAVRGFLRQSVAVGGAPAEAAFKPNPPMNTVRRRDKMHSGLVSSACGQCTEARYVCWRRTAVRAPPVSSRKLSWRLSTIWDNVSAHTPAAASSMARGTPSSRRQPVGA